MSKEITINYDNIENAERILDSNSVDYSVVDFHFTGTSIITIEDEDNVSDDVIKSIEELR